MSEQKPEGTLTSADIKKQIEQAKKDIQNSGMPVTGQLANEINASESTTKEVPQADVKPEPVTAAKDDVDLKQWGKQKGYKEEDPAVLAVLRKADQVYHQRQQEKAKEPAFNTQPQPAYIPPPQSYQQPYNNRQALENVARQYNMPPEDAERLINFNRDFYATISREKDESFRQEVDAIKRENQKNSIFRELSIDPAFKKPEVVAEFTKVLGEMQASDPNSFNDPNTYLKAYDRTQINMFRKQLDGQPLEEGVTPISRPPLTPPRQYGRTSGGGSLENENAIDPREFAKLSLEDKGKMLAKMGLRPAY